MGTLLQEVEGLPTVVKPAGPAITVAKSEALSEAATASAAAIAQANSYTMTTTFVDGTDGTGTVQFVFLDSLGVALTAPISGLLYFSDVATGLSTDALGTGAAVLTNGTIDVVVAATTYHFTTTAAGLLGMTLTNGSADSVWCVFAQGNGTLLISDEMAITGPYPQPPMPWV